MYLEYFDTDDTLGDALAVEVSEQVNMMEVWSCEDQLSHMIKCQEAFTLEEERPMGADLLSGVGTSNGCTV